MNGLVSIQVVKTDGGWFLIGLDNKGNVWKGQPTFTGPPEIKWTLFKEPTPIT